MSSCCIATCFVFVQNKLMRRPLILLNAFLLATSGSALATERPRIAVEFDANHILSVKSEGEADPRTHRLLTVDDPVRIASISKLFVALAVLRLVDKGVLDLDQDVSEYLGWKLRNPSFPESKISLRLLLSHQSSVSDGADYLIPVDQTIQSKMADPKAWDPHHAPGSGWFSYTNLNFPIVASVMEHATTERFDRLMARLLFKPLKLDACFNWSGCSTAKVKRAVVLFRATGEVARDDLQAILPPCPGVAAANGSCDLSGYKPGSNGAIFSPQGGLRISARDLAKAGQLLLRGGRGFLKPVSFSVLITPSWQFDGKNGQGEEGLARSGFFCEYGLAIHRIGTGKAPCNDDLFGDGRERIGHSGEAYGLKSGLWVDRKAGKGISFFLTAVPEDAPTGKSAFYAVEEQWLDAFIKHQ